MGSFTEVDDPLTPVTEQDAQPCRLCIDPLADDEVGPERVGTDDPSSRDVRHEFAHDRPSAQSLSVGAARSLEVDGVVVGVHDQQVAPVVDAVLDAVLASPHDHRSLVGSSVEISRISLLVLLDDWMTTKSSDLVSPTPTK